jgi:hypothetical protein
MNALDARSVLEEDVQAIVAIDSFLSARNSQHNPIMHEIMQHAQDAFDAFAIGN